MRSKHRPYSPTPPSKRVSRPVSVWVNAAVEVCRSGHTSGAVGAGPAHCASAPMLPSKLRSSVATSVSVSGCGSGSVSMAAPANTVHFNSPAIDASLTICVSVSVIAAAAVRRQWPHQWCSRCGPCTPCVRTDATVEAPIVCRDQCVATWPPPSHFAPPSPLSICFAVEVYPPYRHLCRHCCYLRHLRRPCRLC